MRSSIDIQTHAGQLWLGYDLLTSGSKDVEVVPTLVLIAPANKQTDIRS